MIRIVCPSCHAPLSTAELEQVTTSTTLSLACPKCGMVLLSEPLVSEEIAESAETALEA